jgi:hypothetical protein
LFNRVGYPELVERLNLALPQTELSWELAFLGLAVVSETPSSLS